MNEDATPKTASRSRLGDRINTATRSQHARLNRTLILRLPLALPPHAPNPTIYASGLLHVAPIYLVFESLWRNIVLEESTSSTPFNPPLLDPKSLTLFPSDLDHPDCEYEPSPSTCPPELRSILSRVLLPSLTRSPSLHHDIQAITGWTPSEVSAQIRLVAKTGRLAESLAHTKRTVTKNPHVLLAYAWVFYMALFSGGRLIRASLEEPGHSFWDRKADPVAPAGRECDEPAFHREGLPTSFFRFKTPEDGEDLKAEFKKRLNEAEGELSDGQVDDIVQEAVCIFDNMMLLVTQLDGVCGSGGSEKQEKVDDGWMARFLGTRARDSLLIAKERGLSPFLRGEKMDREVKVPEVLDLSKGRSRANTSEVEEETHGGEASEAMSSSMLSPSVVLVEKPSEGKTEKPHVEEETEKIEASCPKIVDEAVQADISPVFKAVRFRSEPSISVIRNKDGGGLGKLQAMSPLVSTAVLIGVVGIIWGLGQLGW